MSQSRQVKFVVLAAIVALIGMFGRSMASAAIDAASTNALPDPYRPVENWAQLPAGVQWGQVINVDPDAHGDIWIFHRSDPAILEFDASGKCLKSFGAGMFVQAHGLTIDHDGNIWVTDAQGKDGKGQQVFKFSPERKVLMTLGKAGVAGNGPDTFNGPSAVIVAPNGDIFIADGHGGDTNARIVKFSKDGKFIKEWGKKGSGPGEFDTPHSLAMDSKGAYSSPTGETAGFRSLTRTENSSPMEAIRPAEWDFHLEGRHVVCGRLPIGRQGESRSQARNPDRKRAKWHSEGFHSRSVNQPGYCTGRRSERRCQRRYLRCRRELNGLTQVC